jgi:hypothetical protein
MYDLRNLAIIRETEKAYQVRQDRAQRDSVVAWIPKSAIEGKRIYGQPDDDGNRRMDCKIEDWLGDEKGFYE